jgi:enamine deaminase RidA (YjgF/YER057c/UK114 family)
MNLMDLVKTVVVAATFAAVATAVAAKECYAPDARAQERAFSRAVTTEGGKAIWLGGQTGQPNADFDGQVRQIFAELDKNIKAVGGSGLKDMVTMTVFITDP